ncbi:DUF2913 family protein [Vibrio sp. SCSIO 43137]|uniref:DUF2913 family protein n=1 Tax=Vibrio sp. SCSIO 43137 TaxID=3021011 RepID=UPI002306DF25|nr:DUF2913 family protein [Vibrio sp. SCSIO 43137]WCE28805.1 DUF2913 family protein [Vibrio sp. SCSIO 43137]
MKTMSNYKYERLLSTTVDNALLHLWISVASSTKQVPRETRNQILVKWFKPKVKQPKYKLIKKELKSMLLVGREKGGLLEERLCELRKLSQHYRKKLTDMHKLHYLLEHLREEHGINADLTEGVVEHQFNTLYVSQEKLESCFSDEKRQIKPVQANLFEIDTDNFVRVVQNFGFHQVKLCDSSPEGMTSIVLRSIN